MDPSPSLYHSKAIFLCCLDITVYVDLLTDSRTKAQVFQSKRGHVSRVFKSDNTPKRDLIDMPPDHTRVDFVIKKDSVTGEFRSHHSTRPPTISWLAQAVRLELLRHLIKSWAKPKTLAQDIRMKGRAKTTPRPIDGSKTSMSESQQNLCAQIPSWISS